MSGSGNARDNGVKIFGFGRLVEEVTTFTDSDLAGSKDSRKSSSAGVIRLGDHAFESIHAKAENHCKEWCRGRAVRSGIGSV